MAAEPPPPPAAEPAAPPPRAPPPPPPPPPAACLIPPSPNWYAPHAADWAREEGLFAFCARNSVVVLEAAGPRAGRVLAVLEGHANRATALCFLRAPPPAAVEAAAEGEGEGEGTAHGGEVAAAAAITPPPPLFDELHIVSAAADRSLRLWSRPAGAPRGAFAPRRCLAGRPAEVRALAALPGGAVAAGDAAGNVFRWAPLEPRSKAARLPAAKRAAAVTCLAAAPADGDDSGAGADAPALLAVGAADGSVGLVDAGAAGAPVGAPLRRHATDVQCLRWAAPPVGGAGAALLASAGGDRRVLLYAAPPAAVAAGAPPAPRAALELPPPPGGLSPAQRERAWAAFDLLPRAGGGAAVVAAGHGGEALWFEVPPPPDADTDVAPPPCAPTRLASPHSRALFSVHAAAAPGGGARLATTAMDRAAAGWAVGPVAPGAVAAAAPPAWAVAGLGGHVYAISVAWEAEAIEGAGGEARAGGAVAAIAVACGDRSVRRLPLRAGAPGGGAPAAGPARLLWHGLTGKATAAAWHPALPGVLAFGCDDGAVGALHAGRERAALAPARHAGAVTRLAWARAPGGAADAWTLLSLSADGALLRWPAWGAELDALIPAGGRAPRALPAPARAALGPPADLAPALALAGGVAALATADGGRLGAAVALGGGAGGLAVRYGPSLGLGGGADAEGAAAALPPPGAPGAGVVAVALEPELGVLAAAREGGALEVYDVSMLEAEEEAGAEAAARLWPRRAAAALPSPATALALGCHVLGVGRARALIAAGLRSGDVEVWAWEAGAAGAPLVRVAALAGHGAAIGALAWLPWPPGAAAAAAAALVEGAGDDDAPAPPPRLLSGSEDQSLRLWDVGAAAAAAELAAAAAAAAAAVEAAAAAATAAEAGDKAEEAEVLPPPAAAAPAAPAAPPPAAPEATPEPASTKKGRAATALDGRGPLLPAPTPAGDDAARHAALRAACLRLAAGEGAAAAAVELDCFADPLAALDPLAAAAGALAARGAGRPPAERAAAAQRAAAAHLWRGDAGAALAALAPVEGALSGDFVAIAAVAGRAAWEAAARLRAAALAARGEPHAAALLLLAVGDAAGALGALRAAGLLRDAVALGSARLPAEHPALVEARVALAAALGARGEHERAAAQLVAARRWAAAARALAARGGAEAEAAAAALAARAGGGAAATAAEELGGLSLEVNGEAAPAAPEPAAGAARRYGRSKLLALRAAALPAPPPPGIPPDLVR
jgi:hypothetical protein